MCAGRLLGNIRQQGTVKRTVIRGRVGARPAGMRLPPPMSLLGADPAKAAPADDKVDQDKPENADKADERVCLYPHGCLIDASSLKRHRLCGTAFVSSNQPFCRCFGLSQYMLPLCLPLHLAVLCSIVHDSSPSFQLEHE